MWFFKFLNEFYLFSHIWYSPIFPKNFTRNVSLQCCYGSIPIWISMEYLELILHLVDKSKVSVSHQFFKLGYSLGNLTAEADNLRSILNDWAHICLVVCCEDVLSFSPGIAAKRFNNLLFVDALSLALLMCLEKLSFRSSVIPRYSGWWSWRRTLLLNLI